MAKQRKRQPDAGAAVLAQNDDLAKLVGEKLRQPNTYVVALMVGTAINIYGHLLVPWVRGQADPLGHFLSELDDFTGLVGFSIVIAYCFPLLVGLYSSVATRYANLDKERNLIRLASFPEKNPNPVIEVDLDARVTYVNPRARERFPGLATAAHAHPLMRDLGRIVKKLKRGKQTHVRETAVGEYVYLQHIVYLADAEMIRLYTADITDRKKAEKELRRLASFPEKNPNPVIEVDLDGEVTYVNPLARERFPDLQREGKVHPLLEGLEDIVATMRKTKVPHDREVRLRGFIYRQNMVFLPESQVVRLYIHDVTTLRELQARIQRNLSELEKAHNELADAQVQLVESEKRAALSQLVAGIAHEINTPVGAIRSMHDTLTRAADKMANLVEQQFAGESKERRQLDAIAKVLRDAGAVIAAASVRVTTIVERMRNFARLDEAEFKTVNVNESLENTLQLVSHEADGRIDIIKELSTVPNLNCFPARLNQAFLTVLMNAIQAIEDRGRVWVSTKADEGHLLVRVRDDGVGIPEEHLTEIFAPGFTTKGVGVGTGLGLSICQRTVQDHGGEIQIESKVGEGTTVTIRLPLSGAAPPPSLRGPVTRRN